MEELGCSSSDNKFSSAWSWFESYNIELRLCWSQLLCWGVKKAIWSYVALIEPYNPDVEIIIILLPRTIISNENWAQELSWQSPNLTTIRSMMCWASNVLQMYSLSTLGHSRITIFCIVSDGHYLSPPSIIASLLSVIKNLNIISHANKCNGREIWSIK